MGWKNFEDNVYDFLKKMLKIENLALGHEGGSDSTKSDIEFLLNNKQKFLLEVKQNIAQAGQFVVCWDAKNKKYAVTDKTKCKLETKAIIMHMNNNDYYRSEENFFLGAPNGKRKAIELICDKKLMYKRVIALIKTKSSFIASSHYERDSNFSSENPLIIEEIDDLENYFDISGSYRPKFSGTRKLPKKEYGDIKKKFDCVEMNDRLYLETSSISSQKVYLTEALTFTSNRFDAVYYLSDSDNNSFKEIKKLSTTYNSNVIFTLKLKEELKHTDLKNLIEALNKP